MAAGKPAQGSEVEGVDVAALQAQLAEAKAQVEALKGGAPAGGDRLAEVLEKLAESIADRGIEQADIGFKPGEAPEDVLKSLEGKVTRGEHSGKLTPGGIPIVFLSKGKNHVLLKKGRVRFTNARGELVVTEGVQYDFSPDGRFETDDQEVADYIQSRPNFGVEVYQMGFDPAAAPDPQPVLDTILEATIELDDARLAALEAEEQAGLKRDLVLKTVAAARRRVQGMGEPADADAVEATA
jgi:hypothetical protein